MRKLMNKIDRFCYAHPRFGIPNLMLIIVIGNAAVWLLTKMDTTGQIASLLCGSAQGILHGQVWRLVTYVFVPTEASPIWQELTPSMSISTFATRPLSMGTYSFS